jgi:hypothetical protein
LATWRAAKYRLKKVGILNVIGHYLCIALHGPALGRFVSVFADTTLPRTRAVARDYVYATDERGTRTPPANAHVRGRVRAYIPIIVVVAISDTVSDTSYEPVIIL